MAAKKRRTQQERAEAWARDVANLDTTLDDVIAHLIRDDDPLEARNVIVRGSSPEQVGRAVDKSRAICPDIICGPVLPYGDEWAAPVLITLPRSTWLELDANRAALAEVPRG